MFNTKKPIIVFLKYKDLPSCQISKGLICVDSEFLGLNVNRDRLCLVQIFDPRKNKIFILQLPRNLNRDLYPNLIEVMISKDYCKIFHYSPADISFINKAFGINVRNTLCTRTLSKIARTAANSHSLHTLTKMYIGKSLNKNYSNDYWGKHCLSKEQMIYASNDVIYLHLILVHLMRIAIWENRLIVFKRANRIIELSIPNNLVGFSTEELLAHH